MNNKGADQTARMRRLVCTCVVRTLTKTVFLASWPIYNARLMLHLIAQIKKAKGVLKHLKKTKPIRGT